MAMNVTFCGHAKISDQNSVQRWLFEVTQALIEQGATTFYLGGYGSFDGLAARVLRKQKETHPDIKLVLVRPYLNRNLDSSGYDYSVYPPLESVPPHLAIPKRNQWMVDASQVVVSYVLHNWGGAAATLRYARQKKKIVLSYAPGVTSP